MRLAVASVLLLAAAGDVAAHTDKKPPALVMVCELGAVHRMESHLASGSVCVIHDSHGDATTAGSVSIYNDELTVP